MNTLLGLPELDLSLPFMDLFETHFAHRLLHRADGFRTIFQHLPTDSFIVETGCLRALGNWGGDGQSTFLFDLFTQMNGGSVVSIDLNPTSTAIAKQVCPKAQIIEGDGTKVINSLYEVSKIDLLIDLLYLDSFDHGRDVSVIPAPVHYLLELCAAWPFLAVGSLIAIDDFHSPETGSVPATKGLGVEMFLEKVGAQVLYDGYQKIWKL